MDMELYNFSRPLEQKADSLIISFPDPVYYLFIKMIV
jgi:hypothetical protein